MPPRFSLVLPLIALCATMAAARAGETVTLAWDPNPEPDLAGYRLFWGLGSRNYLEIRDVENVTSYELQLPFDDETYFFAVTAYNDVGLESGFSDEIWYPDPPATSGTNDQQLSIRTRENTPVIVDFSGIPDLSPIPAHGRYVVVGAPEHGWLDGALSGLTYHPSANYQGPDSFRLIAYAPTNGTLTTLFKASAQVVVTPPNVPPIAYDGEVFTAAGIPVPVQLRADDYDLDPLEYDIVDWPAHGRLLGEPPQFHYLPDAAFEGQDLLTFKARDARYESELASITLKVQSDDGVLRQQFLVTAEDTPLEVDLNQSWFAPEEDAEPPQFSLLAPPALGTLEGEPPRMIYQPQAEVSGLDQIQFGVGSDPFYGESIVWVLIEPVNDAPVAEPQSVTMDEDSQVEITLSGTDVEGDSLTYTVLTIPAHGDLSGTPPELSYLPFKDYHGDDTLTFKVNDGNRDSDPATVEISVTSVNDPPVVEHLEVSAEPDTSRTIQLAGSDVEGDLLSFEVLTMPIHGTLRGTPPGITYEPAPGYVGSDRFGYRAWDGENGSDEAIVAITIQRLELPVEEWPAILDVTPTADGLTLAWTAIPGYTYRVVSRPEPASGDWTAVSPDLVADADTLSFSHGFEEQGAATFYAIRVVSKD